MEFATRAILIAGSMFGLAAGALAGPPGGSGHSFRGPISGTAPLGASGPAPIGASGSLIGNPYPGAGYRNSGNRGGYTHGGYTHGGYSSGRSGRGDLHGGDLHGGDSHRGGHRDYGRLPASFFFAPYYYPSLGYESAPFDNGYEGPDVGQDPAMQSVVESQGQLGQQVQRLTSEIEQLKEQQASPYVTNSSSPPETEQPPNTVPVTLILRGGQTLKVRDYAVLNGVFWDFTNQSVHKIALSDVDLDASAKATQANGGDFPDILNPQQGH